MKRIRPSRNRSRKRAASMVNLVFSLLFLLLQFESSYASNPGLSDELRFINQEIGFLRNENQQQNTEISLLKKLVMNSNEDGGESAHQESIIEGLRDHQQLNQDRHGLISKRPARLLPLQLLFNRNCTTCNDQPIPRFYGPPTNCFDLSKLGYTLNGFYMVTAPTANSNTNINSLNSETTIATVFCAFKHPSGLHNAPILEKRVTPLKSEGNLSKPILPSAEVASIKLENNSRSYSKLILTSTEVAPLKLVNSSKNIVNFTSRIQMGRVVLNTASRNRLDLKFTKVFSVGGGFDEKTGWFEAPKSGEYKLIFRATLFIPKHVLPHQIKIAISANLMCYNRSSDKHLSAGTAEYNWNHGNSRDFGIEKTLKLNRGEKVYLKLVVDPSKSFKDSRLASVRFDEEKSFFSGLLLSEF